MPKTSDKNIGLNLGPKTTAELAAVGIKTLAQLQRLGWEKALLKLIVKYPERLNLNMACGLIGAELGKDWRKIPAKKKQEAKALIKSLKPRKAPAATKPRIDLSFVEYIVSDQLSSLDIQVCRMFGAHGLYLQGKFVAIIHDGAVFLKTNEQTRRQFIAAGMQPFRPTPKQTLKSYYQVPADVVEDTEMLTAWFAQAAAAASKA